MSKLDELIEKLCPTGVRYMKIKEVCDGHYGKGNNIPTDGGKYPVYGCNGIVGYTSTFNSVDSPIVGHIGTAGVVTWGRGKHYVTYNGTICTPKKEIINSKYLYYNLQKEHLEKYVKGSQPFLSFSDFENLKIPIPPIGVQNEIVQILDNFTGIEEELEEELKEELELTKKRYDYYKEKMLKFSKKDLNVEWVNLGTYCKRLKGTAITASKMKEIAKNDGNVKIFAGGKTVIETSENNVPQKDIITVPNIIVQSRGVIDFIYYDKPCSYKREMWSYTTDNEITLKFIYYYLKNNLEYFRQRGSQMGSMPQISLEVTEKYKIPIPRYEEQERIVSILNRFDKLCNDISQDLLAEIEARKKQYEYYRDRLLAFEELKDE